MIEEPVAGNPHGGFCGVGVDSPIPDRFGAGAYRGMLGQILRSSCVSGLLQIAKSRDGLPPIAVISTQDLFRNFILCW
jgi:hypothetical protein